MFRNFIQKHDLYIFSETTHVIPLTLNEEQRNNRRIYSIKLSDFPTGTSARDLHDIIAAPEQLQGLSYAYMNCETDEDLFNATAKDYNFLLVRFRPAQHRKLPKSYAEVAKDKNISQHINNGDEQNTLKWHYSWRFNA
ncbi:20570_t:CDS:2 [Entrophospora sp. SA101]|nr:13496_t:CDS:2 [Entrophospora sp. SA101]CAJ0763696.1 20570_t:CDS:2 [Entrophospora sp. SA101]